MANFIEKDGVMHISYDTEEGAVATLLKSEGIVHLSALSENYRLPTYKKANQIQDDGAVLNKKRQISSFILLILYVLSGLLVITGNLWLPFILTFILGIIFNAVIPEPEIINGKVRGGIIYKLSLGAFIIIIIFILFLSSILKNMDFFNQTIISLNLSEDKVNSGMIWARVSLILLAIIQFVLALKVGTIGFFENLRWNLIITNGFLLNCVMLFITEEFSLFTTMNFWRLLILLLLMSIISLVFYFIYGFILLGAKKIINIFYK